VAFELSSDLPAPLIPLAWLIGKWAGVGVIGYPTIEEARFGQEIEFSHDGRPFLTYRSLTWLLDDDGNQVRPLASESGYWRPIAASVGHADDADGETTASETTATEDAVPGAAPQPSTEIELLLAHPTGFVEIYLGTVRGPRIDLATDLVARTSTAKEYTAATRLYGLVESDLLWAMDMAAMGQPLQSHASARLKRL
jgi:hypothetical protein